MLKRISLKKAISILALSWLATSCADSNSTSEPTASPSEKTVSTIHRSCVAPGMVALTFDDGPTKYYDELLTHLADKAAKATFYVLGWTLEEQAHADRLRRAAAGGHQIDSHSWGHGNITTMSNQEITKQLTDTSDKIFEIIGKRPSTFRPPYGAYDSRSATLIQGMGYPIVLWNLDTRDWDGNVTEEAIFSAFSRRLDADPSRNSYIALQHDKRAESVELVPEIIDLVRSKGYRLVTINECLGLR